MFYMQCFTRLASLGAVLTRLCCCAYGSPFKKPLQFLHNKPWLLELSCKCTCPKTRPHFIVQGSFTRDSVPAFEAACVPSSEAVFGKTPKPGQPVASFSAAYPMPLVRRMAAGSSQAKMGSCPVIPLSAKHATLGALGLRDLETLPCFEGEEPSSRAFHDDPEWIGELADSLEFRELLRYKFSRPSHINVLETRSYKTWLKWCAIRHPHSRLLGLIDSRVLLGAAAKGRSSSEALCRVLRSSLPYVLGGGLYPGGLHVYSAANRSDGPSRGRPVAPPTKPTPLWLEKLRDGDAYPFDVVTAASRVPKLAARWLRLLLLLGGDIEPHPGPPCGGAPQGPLDLQSGFAASTRYKMDKAMDAFTVWLESDLNISLPAVLQSAQTAATALRGFGLHLYAAGLPRYLLVYAITAVQDAYPEFRSHLTPAWQVDRKWQQMEPGESRPVISQPILQAAICLALIWGWKDWAAVTLVGFLCMLHPAEIVPLIRQDLVLPRDALSSDLIAYVHVKHPKTQRFARRQHSRLEDELSIKFLDKLYGSLPLSEKLFRGSMHMYRRQWDAIMDRLGVPHRLADKGATPGVLRGSGATFLYLETEDISLVAWRGRWSKIKTVEFYLQEVAAQLMLQRLSSNARDRISFLRSFARRLILAVIDS